MEGVPVFYKIKFFIRSFPMEIAEAHQNRRERQKSSIKTPLRKSFETAVWRRPSRVKKGYRSLYKESNLERRVEVIILVCKYPLMIYRQSGLEVRVTRLNCILIQLKRSIINYYQSTQVKKVIMTFPTFYEKHWTSLSGGKKFILICGASMIGHLVLLGLKIGFNYQPKKLQRILRTHRIKYGRPSAYYAFIYKDRTPELSMVEHGILFCALATAHLIAYTIDQFVSINESSTFEDFIKYSTCRIASSYVRTFSTTSYTLQVANNLLQHKVFKNSNTGVFGGLAELCSEAQDLRRNVSLSYFIATNHTMKAAKAKVEFLNYVSYIRSNGKKWMTTGQIKHWKNMTKMTPLSHPKLFQEYTTNGVSEKLIDMASKITDRNCIPRFDFRATDINIKGYHHCLFSNPDYRREGLKMFMEMLTTEDRIPGKLGKKYFSPFTDLIHAHIDLLPGKKGAYGAGDTDVRINLTSKLNHDAFTKHYPNLTSLLNLPLYSHVLERDEEKR